MNLIISLSSLWSFFTNHPRIKSASIDLTDNLQLTSLGRITSDLAEDIYCNTLELPKCGDNFFSFTHHDRYSNGKVIKTIKAEVKDHMPKMLVYDWNGDSKVGIGKTRIIALRGTHSLQEWVGNFDCQEKNHTELGLNVEGYFHTDFAKVGKEIWNKYKDYILKSDSPVVITGHSRGGALAEVLHVIAKKELLKQNSPSQIYCMAYAPPPSMYLTGKDARELTKDIHGFVNGVDVVPRFFIDDIIDVIHGLIGQEKATKIFDKICKLIFKSKTCKTEKGAIGAYIVHLIGMHATEKIKSYAAEGLLEKIDVIKSIYDNYSKDKSIIHITRHVGNLYQLKFTNFAGTDDYGKINGCVKNTMIDAKLESPRKFKKFCKTPIGQLNRVTADHRPDFYRHSFYDPLCSSLIHKFVNDINLNMTNAKAPSLFRDQTLPSWAPSFEDEDDLFECNNESVSSDKEFIWTSINDNMHCEGIATNCQINQIVSLTCKNFTHLCVKDKDGQSTCHQINSSEGDEKNRCNSTPDDDCSYNQLGSSASCSNEDKSSEKSSSRKSSRSSGRKSSSKSSEIDPLRCKNKESCPSNVLGNFKIKVAYIGGTSVIDDMPGHKLIQNVKHKVAPILPPLNFQHTAMWIGSSDVSDETLGAIVVYGEYYSSGTDPTYLTCDGARAYVMSLGRFKQTFEAYKPKKLLPTLNLTYNKFIKQIVYTGNWGVDDYHWPTHNCQHFTAYLVKLLQAKRTNPDKYDWVDLPKSIMREIVSTEL